MWAKACTCLLASRAAPAEGAYPGSQLHTIEVRELKACLLLLRRRGHKSAFLCAALTPRACRLGICVGLSIAPAFSGLSSGSDTDSYADLRRG